MISGPKGVLVSMRKTQDYRAKKLMFLSKLVALDQLQHFMNDDDEEPDEARDWFKAYRVFPGSDEVMRRFRSGQALSGFVTEDAPNEVKIAYSSGNYGEYGVWSLNFSMRDMYTKEMGMHFCKFDFVRYTDSEGKCRIQQTTLTKKEIVGIMKSHVILLPYKKDGHAFGEQFTIVYSDYDVLVPGHSNKDLPTRDPLLFSDEYFRNLR